MTTNIRNQEEIGGASLRSSSLNNTPSICTRSDRGQMRGFGVMLTNSIRQAFLPAAIGW